MSSVLSLFATLLLLGVAFAVLHLGIVWLGASDLLALLVFAAPIAAYIAYCTQPSRRAMINFALRSYCTFAAVVLAAVGLVYVIGT